MHTDIRRLATSLDIKLQVMHEMSVATHQQSQIESVNNLKSCVRSAATVLSSASTTLSLENPVNPQDIDDVTWEFGTDWFRTELTETTQSWVFQQAIDK